MKKHIIKLYFKAIEEKKIWQLYMIVKVFKFVLHTENDRGDNGLILALITMNYDAMSFLISQGIDPNTIDRDGWSPKTWAIFLNDNEAMKRLKGLTALAYSKCDNTTAFNGWILASLTKR